MTVDQDLLADYLGGALVGTAEHARVAELIATDPEWAAAAATLSAAMDAVATGLAALPTPVMPPEVAARLEAALTADRDSAAADPDSAPASTTGTSTDLPGAGTVPAPRSRPGTGRPVPDRPASRPVGRARRRRLSRWSGGAVAAAAVLGFSWFGYSALIDGPNEAGDGGFRANSAPEPATALDQPAPGASADHLNATGPALLATGVDYQPMQLSGPPPQAIGTDQRGDWSAESIDPSPLTGPQITNAAVVPPPLQQLWSDPALRAACLVAVADTVPDGPAEIHVVDFARFQGEPAMVIWLTDASGEPVVVVSGAECGSPEAGADERYRTAPN